MKSVFLVMHQKKDNLRDIARQATSALRSQGIAVFAEPWIAEKLGDEASALLTGMTVAGCEAIIAIGGDGTLLRANAMSVENRIPLIGVNIGTVGFLTETELDGLNEVAKRLKNNDYTIETRMMLKAELNSQTMLALNDVVVSRGGYSRLIGVNAWVGDEQVGRYIGDGLIVSTATGSTGYSLSAGGPIVCPQVDCLLLTPICAHTLQHRPVITSPERKIVISLDDTHAPMAVVSVDGQENMELRCGDRLVVTRADCCARFIKLGPQDFFSKIRYKLSEWSC